MTEIKAIETEYNGYKFRSRLEARWAVFFDACGIKYEYEPEGFDLGNGVYYLPDFYLPKLDVYVEVKAERNGWWNEIANKTQKAVAWGGIKKIVILSEIPNYESIFIWHFPCFYYSAFRDEAVNAWYYFFYDYVSEKGNGRISSQYIPPFGGCRVEDCGLSAKDGWHLTVEEREAPYTGFWETDFFFIEPPKLDTDKWSSEYQKDENRLIYEAYKKARQARFEHGEKP